MATKNKNKLIEIIQNVLPFFISDLVWFYPRKKNKKRRIHQERAMRFQMKIWMYLGYILFFAFLSIIITGIFFKKYFDIVAPFIFVIALICVFFVNLYQLIIQSRAVISEIRGRAPQFPESAMLKSSSSKEEYTLDEAFKLSALHSVTIAALVFIPMVILAIYYILIEPLLKR